MISIGIGTLKKALLFSINFINWKLLIGARLPERVKKRSPCCLVEEFANFTETSIIFNVVSIKFSHVCYPLG